MKREVSFLRHASILFLTLVILSLGVFIGGDLEQMRVQSLYTQLQEQDIEYQKIVTEGVYIDYLLENTQAGDNVSCDVVEGAYFTSIDNLDQSRIKLEEYINSAQVREEEYQRLREHYSNLQINYWLMGQKIRDLCGQDIDIILFFFSQDKKVCPACEDQGIHLSYVKQRLGDSVLIFSLDADEKGPVQLVAQKYGIQNRETPVVVINEEIYGFLDNGQILEKLES